LSYRPTNHRKTAALAVGALLLGTIAFRAFADGQAAANPRNVDTKVTGNLKVDHLLAQMTLEEKIALIHGAGEDPSTDQGQAGYLPGLARLGIPAMRLSDGPPGVLTRHSATGLTATMGLAATFSRQDAIGNGAVIGRDAKSLGIDVVLEPYINITRDFTFTRAYNTYGEDPLLTGQIASGVVSGIQGQGVLAQAKHYIVYDGSNDVIVDPQTLREIYVAPFADVVNAGVSSVMCSYNKVNGTYACGNADTLNTILRDELHFKGFVTSDWGAAHSADFINRGMDMEMPGTAGGFIPSYFAARVPPPAPPKPGPFEAPFGGGGIPEEEITGGGYGGFGAEAPPVGMLEAVNSGVVSEAAIARAAGRILVQMDRFGLLDGAKTKHSVTPIQTAANAPILQKTAEDSGVLLKNEDNALPLVADDLASLAMIGPGAGQTIAIGISGEKALGIASRQVGTIFALRKYAIGAAKQRITYAVADDMTGTPVPAAALSHDGAAGLLRSQPGNQAGGSGQTQVDALLNFTKSNGHALPAGSSFDWTGTLTVPSGGSYLLYLQILGASGSMSVDGKKVAQTGGLFQHGNILQPAQDNLLPTTDNLDNTRTKLALSAGAHAISVSARGEQAGQPVQARLNWVTPEQQQANYAAAVTAARQAKKAVVFAWARGRPDFGLPGDQNKLIADVAAANPNTIVVLNTSLPVAMPWLGQVKAVLEMWYPGDEGGWATAKLLLGRSNPAGRLPVTWPQSLDQMVANQPAHPERSSRGVDGKTTYSEGIYVGYRWFDQQKLEPLFPFGYGLSYSKFEYSGLKVSRAADGGLYATFRIRNSGKRTGDEIPQLYLGAPDEAPAGAQFAEKSLVAFERVGVPAGQSKDITLHVSKKQLQYWSVSANKWVTAEGLRTVYVAASSRDVRLQAKTDIPAPIADR
jgi:beta-glucosidase